MSEIDIMLGDAPVFVQISPPVQVNVSVAQPSQVGVMLGGSIVYLGIDQPAPVNVQMAVPPPINVSVSPVAGPPGIQGIPGVRGSLLVGGYASFVNLPPLGNFNVGDYAFVQDTGEIFQIEDT